MKNIQLKLLYTLLFILFVSIGLHAQGPPTTFTFADWQWTDVNGYGIGDANIPSSGQDDAYDGAFRLAIGTIGTDFNNATNAAIVTGNTTVGFTITRGTQDFSGLRVSTVYFLHPTLPIVRILYNFENITDAPITTDVFIKTNLGSNGRTVTETTASGDNIIGAGDRWTITKENNGPTYPDPINTLVHYGTGMVSSQATFEPSGVGDINTKYTITVPAGEVRSLLVFGRLDKTPTDAINYANVFNSVDNMTTAGLFDGIDNKERILNWVFSSPTFPGIPTNVAAKAGSGQVTLSWEAATFAQSYEIYMYSATSPQRLVGSTANTTFTITGLENGITYFFRIKAVGISGESDFSNTVSARPSIVLSSEEGITNNAFKLYPNPTNGKLNLFISELQGKNAQISVLDMSGRVVYEQNVTTAGSLETELNLNLASGMYLLQISTDKENLRRKLLIER